VEALSEVLNEDGLFARAVAKKYNLPTSTLHNHLRENFNGLGYPVTAQELDHAFLLQLFLLTRHNNTRMRTFAH